MEAQPFEGALVKSRTSLTSRLERERSKDRAHTGSVAADLRLRGMGGMDAMDTMDTMDTLPRSRRD